MRKAAIAYQPSASPSAESCLRKNYPPPAGRARRLAQRGGALLAVLWLSAALSAIAFTLAITVRGELQRASDAIEGVRAYYLAEGAIEHFLFQLGSTGTDRQFRPGQRRLRWDVSSGSVDLEITGENGKLHVLAADPGALSRLMALLGVEPDRARQIAQGIVTRRTPAAGGNLSPGSSFSPQLPSFLQLEDLLTVGGMTFDVYYGWWDRAPGEAPEGAAAPRLMERGGVSRYLTMVGGGGINVNYAAPVVLRAAGVPEGAMAAILQAREGRVIEDPTPFGVGSLPGGMQLIGGGSPAYTVRATAQLNGRPVRRTVTALVRFGQDATEPPLGVVRWYPAGN